MSDDWWADFANNLATDFAPLVALFGEAPTKQYLSECLTATDIFIFATAPLGVITAIVSAIRVCGTPSLRAFIGRAQEGAGNAEAELCSSTSRDVCELYNNGGIARVFGRPKLLEIVHDSEATLEDFFDQKKGRKPTAGIYFFEEFKNEKDSNDNEWREVTGRSTSIVKAFKSVCGKKPDARNGPEPKKKFAQNPNLSLNVGIRPLPKPYFYAAATLGFALQSAVLVWAVVARYRTTLGPKGVQDKYAVPLTVIGTICLGFGVGLCAYLVERSTQERVFDRESALDPSNYPLRTRMYWVQPGNQVIGDQVFDSFAYSDIESPMAKYTTSWKQDEVGEGLISTTNLVWTAVLFALVGFVMQFVGLRACHSSVSLAQLIATVMMSIVRASLRTKRIEKRANLAKDADHFQGHELDWLALAIDSPSSQHFLVFSNDKGSKLQILRENFDLARDQNDGSENSQATVLRLSFRGSSGVALAGLLYLKSQNSPARNTESKIFELHPSYPKQDTTGSTSHLQATTKSFFYRARLARMTGLDDMNFGGSRTWEQTLVSVRHTAQLLADAIEATAAVLFVIDTSKPIEIKKPWGNCFNLFCPINIAMLGTQATSTRNSIYISLSRTFDGEKTPHMQQRSDHEAIPNGPWRVDKAELEALLGLWIWSLRDKFRLWSQTSTVRCSKLFIESASLDLELWRPSQKDMKNIQMITLDLRQSSRPDADTDFEKAAELHNALWWRDKNQFVMERKTHDEKYKHIPPNEAHDVRHFFGLQHFDLSEASSKVVSALELSSVRSLALGCAQELYTKVFDGIMHSIGSLGGESEVRRGRESFHFVNENIDRLYTAFTQSGLGSADNAFACVIPVLHAQKKLPSVRDALAHARSIAEKYSSKGNWEQASDMLVWALQCIKSSRSAFPEDVSAEAKNEERLCIFELCECYRNAYSDRKLWKSLPSIYSNIAKLFRSEYSRLNEEATPLLYVDPSANSESYVSAYSCTLAEILISYAEVAYRVARDEKARFNDPVSIRELETAILESQTQELLEDPYYYLGDQQPGDLAEAIASGDLSSAISFLDDEDAVQSTWDDRTALSHAAEWGWFTIVKALTKGKVDIDARDESNRSSLYYAVKSGDINTFRYLMSIGANPNIADENGLTVLDCAVDNGHATIMQDLLHNPRFDLNQKGPFGRTTLSRAAQRGAVSVVEELLSSDRVDLNAQDNDGSTPLMLAVENGHTPVVEQLVKDRRINLKISDAKERTAFSRAVFHGRGELVKFFLSLNLGLAITSDNSGRSPLSQAVCGNVIKEDGEKRRMSMSNHDSIRTGINDDHRNDGDQRKVYLGDWLAGRKDGNAGSSEGEDVGCDVPGTTGLHSQSSHGDHGEIIRELLRHPEVNPNSPDDDGRTPLSHAVLTVNANAVEQLLATEDVDPNFVDEEGNSALALAITNGFSDMVALLLASPEIDTSQKNESGDNSLSLAARMGYTSIVEQLLSHGSTQYQSGEDVDDSDESLQTQSSYTGALVNSRNLEGDTPLIVACRNGRDAVALLLLTVESIEINERGKNQDTALMIASRDGRDVIVEKLLSFEETEINVKDSNGDTPLIAAARNGRDTIVSKLLNSFSILVNAQNRTGQTALAAAVESQHVVCVERLLSHSELDVNLQDLQGQTALHSAAKGSNVDIALLIVEDDRTRQDTEDEKGNTPLLTAAYEGDHSMVIAFIKSGKFDLLSRNHSGMDLISQASVRG